MFRNILNSFFVFLFFVSFLGLAPQKQVFAGFSSVPDRVLYAPNSTVNTIVSDEKYVYLGGLFTGVDGKFVGGGTSFDSQTGQIVFNYPDDNFPLINGNIYRVISDGDGGWFVGGIFTKVGLYDRQNFVHILSNGSVNEDLVLNFNGMVTSMALSSDNNTLYVGGQFTQVNGITRNRLAAFDLSNSQMTSFDPNISNSVDVMVLSSDDSVLYIGGTFFGANSVNGNVARNRVAAITTSNGLATAFDPNVSNRVYAMVLSIDDSVLYIGGDFASVQSPSVVRRRAAAFTTSNGVVTAFDPDLSNSVYSMDFNADETMIYLGGVFATVNNGITRRALARFSTDSGVLDGRFNANIPTGEVDWLQVADDGVVYAGGTFTTVNTSVARSRAAAFDIDGLATAFNPNLNGAAYALALSEDDSNVFLGGLFSFANYNLDHSRLARFNMETKELDKDFIISFNGNVSALDFSADKNVLYVGGTFTSVTGSNGSITRNRIAAINLSDLSVSDFDPNITDGGVNSIFYNSSNSVLYVGGSFTSVNNNIIRNRFASFDQDGLVTDFNPNLNNSVSRFSENNGYLYVGGSFTSMNGGATTINRVAKFSLEDNFLVSDFNPNIANGQVSSMAIDNENNIIYLGGTFTTVNGSVSRNRLAGFDLNTGIAVSFNPNITNNDVLNLFLTRDKSILYSAGSFTSVNSNVNRNRIASFNTTNGLVTDFNPNFNGTINFLHPTYKYLYAGGNFTNANADSFFHRLVHFSDAVNPDTIIVSGPNSPSLISNISFVFSGSDDLTNEKDLTFECGLNGSDWVECEKEYEINNMSNGEHVLEVRAVDMFGNKDSTSASYHWRVEAPPVLIEVSAIGNTNSKKIIYTFSSSSTGYLTYGGSCNSSYVNAVVGNNIIELDELEYGTYADCTILLTDEYGVQSNLLEITPFNIVIPAVNSRSGSFLSPTVLKGLNISIDPNYSPWTPNNNLGINLNNTTSNTSSFNFTRTLRILMTGEDVKELQKLLNTKGFIVSEKGPGSIGNETTMFGSKTRAALIRFQRANTPLSPDGVFGPMSRAVLTK